MNRNYEQNATYQREVLEYITFGLADIVDRGQLQQMRFTEERDEARAYGDSVIRMIRYSLLGQNTHDEVTEDETKTYPTTMWEELKRDFWPDWLVAKFPVRYTREVKHVLHKHYNICPHLNAPQGNHLEFVVTRKSFTD